MDREAEFETHAEAGKQDSWETSSRETVETGIPPEFDGEFEGMAPENLYALSLTNCFVATFNAISKRSNFDFEKIEADGVLEVGQKDGETMMKTMNLEVTVYSPEDKDKAEIILEKTENNCWILNSVKTELNIQTSIR
jgi:organic hydroperoxide reductase OsmC/OhrA